MWDMCGTIQRSGLLDCIVRPGQDAGVGRTVTVCKTAGSGPAQVRVDHWWPRAGSQRYGLAAHSLPGSAGLAVCLVTPEHVPDEGNRSQRSTGSDAHGYRPLNMMGKGRRTRAGSRASPRAGPCPAPAGNTVRHLQKERADDRERHRSAQDVLGHVPRCSAGLAQAADRSQVLGRCRNCRRSQRAALPRDLTLRWIPRRRWQEPHRRAPSRSAGSEKTAARVTARVAISVAVQRRAIQSSRDRPRMLVQPEPIRTVATRAANAVRW